MKMRFIILALLIAGLLFAGCEYRPPPKGEEGYCYRVDYSQIVASQDIIAYTDIEPRWKGDQLVLEDVWFAANDNGSGAALCFDFTEKLVLDRNIADKLAIRGQEICWAQQE